MEVNPKYAHTWMCTEEFKECVTGSTEHLVCILACKLYVWILARILCGRESSLKNVYFSGIKAQVLKYLVKNPSQCKIFMCEK